MFFIKGDNFWGVVWGKHHPQQPMGNCSSMIPVRRNGTTKVFSQSGCLPLGLRWGDIPYNSENKPRGLYFSKDLFERLIFGGAYILRGLSTEGNLRFKIYWASLIVGRKFTVFALFYFVFEGNFQVQAPGGLIFQRRVQLYFVLWLRGLIFGGAYTWRGFFLEFYGNTWILLTYANSFYSLTNSK